jgi:hypothetical protein
LKRIALLPLVAALAIAACGPSPSQYESGVTALTTKDGKAVAVTTGKDDKGNKTKVVSIKGRVVVPKGFKAGALAPAPGATVSVADRSYNLKQAAKASDEKFSETSAEGVEVYLATPEGRTLQGAHGRQGRREGRVHDQQRAA